MMANVSDFKAFKIQGWVKDLPLLRSVKSLFAGLALIGLSSVKPSLAVDVTPWHMGLTDPATPIARMMIDFHNYWLMPLITGVVVFVMILLAYTCWRFRASKNPVPTKTTHNTLLEVIWTGVPVIILLVLAFPSIRLLYATDNVANSEMTLKITGHQWYWKYEYPDHGGFAFDAYLLARTAEEAEEMNAVRLMDTDNAVVLPVNTKIRLQFTSADVLHNWAVSAFGVRVDTVPGRLSEAWVSIDRPGRYYGFCSELCGVDHAFMPIMVDAVSKEEFEAWVAEAKDKFASIPNQIESNLLIASK